MFTGSFSFQDNNAVMLFDMASRTGKFRLDPDFNAVERRECLRESCRSGAVRRVDAQVNPVLSAFRRFSAHC